MKSFNRIRCLNSVVDEVLKAHNLENAVVADIATDHGYLAEQLSRNPSVKKIYATDISQKCLDKTNDLVSKFNLQKIETKIGDGLNAINKVDLVVIAGVGGYEIIKMLSNQNITINFEKKCKIFVLQPSRNEVDLRRFLIDENIEISRDFIVKSGGRFYPIIVANLNKTNSTEKSVFNLYFGKDNDLKNQDFLDYLKELILQLGFCENVDKNNANQELKIKCEIYELAKKFINKSKGD